METKQTILQRLKFFLNPNDGRYEDLNKGNLTKNIFKDLTAGLIVAAVAIPLAMGFAMASGLRPEQPLSSTRTRTEASSNETRTRPERRQNKRSEKDNESRVKTSCN